MKYLWIGALYLFVGGAFAGIAAAHHSDTCRKLAKWPGDFRYMAEAVLVPIFLPAIVGTAIFADQGFESICNE